MHKLSLVEFSVELDMKRCEIPDETCRTDRVSGSAARPEMLESSIQPEIVSSGI